MSVKEILFFILTIPGRPVPWKAPKSGQGKYYSPQDMSDYQTKVKSIFNAKYAGVWPAYGPVVLRIKVFAPEKTGDLTNVVKNIEDALEGCAYYNDRQVVGINVIRVVEENESDYKVEVLVVCEK